MNLVGIISGLALLFTCLGLLGLATYTVERKTREIGIRKVLGATESSVIKLLTSKFLKLVVISNLISLPIGWFFGRFVINIFVINPGHRSPVGIMVILAPFLLTILTALLTVASQTLKAARSNPVDTLKME